MNKFAKFVIFIVATLAVVAPLALVTAPAEASSCATAAQNRQIHNGMSLLRVQQIMHSPSYIEDSGVVGRVQWQLRIWQKCSGGLFDYAIGFLRGPVSVTGHYGWYVTLQDSKAPARAASPQSQAIAMAYEYLHSQAFSKGGLADQLVYEGFSRTVSNYAVNHIAVNWRRQAVRMANEYLNSQAFSCSGLIDQLVYEKFSYANAYYGAHHSRAC